MQIHEIIITTTIVAGVIFAVKEFKKRLGLTPDEESIKAKAKHEVKIQETMDKIKSIPSELQDQDEKQIEDFWNKKIKENKRD